MSIRELPGAPAVMILHASRCSQRNKRKKIKIIKSILKVFFKRSEDKAATEDSGQRQWLRGVTPRPRQGGAAVLCWSGHEEIPYAQGKRNPSKTVGAERGHQRSDRLKPQSQTTSQSDTWTTALSNSMKLSHAVCGHPGRVGHGGEV